MSREIIGGDEVLLVGSQLVVGFVEISFGGGVLDGAVHSFDLPVGSWVLGLCQPMVDVVLGASIFASIFEGVRPNRLPSVEGGLDVRRG